MSETPRLPADAVLNLARVWFSQIGNHERDQSQAFWLPEICDETAAEYLALFGLEVLRTFPATIPNEGPP